MLRLLAPLAAFLALVLACSRAEDVQLEPVDVRAVAVGGGRAALDIHASSGGCTSPEHFEVRRREERGVQHVSVRRIRQDLCKADVPGGVTLRLDVPGLRDDAPILLENPRVLAIER